MDGCAGAHPSESLMGVLFVRAAWAAGFLMAKRNRLLTSPIVAEEPR